jgi:hypothetical protein
LTNPHTGIYTVRAVRAGRVRRIFAIAECSSAKKRSPAEGGEWNGRSQEKDFKGEAGFAPGAEHEAALAGAFRVSALS